MIKLIPYILSACLTIAFSFLAPEKAFSQTDQGHKMDSVSDGTYVTGLTAGRARSLVGAVAGLLSLVIGWKARTRLAAGRSDGRSWAITALVLGVAAIVLSVAHLASVTGGFGTGGGKAGAIVALVLGLTGTAFSGLALRLKKQS